MDSQLVQRTRRQLEVRVRRTFTCPPALFPSACKHLVEWVESHALLRHLLDPLRAQVEKYELETRTIVQGALDEEQACGPAPYRDPRSSAPLPVILVRPLWPTASFEDQTALAWAGLRVLSGIDFTAQNTHVGHLVGLVVAGCQPALGENADEVLAALRNVVVHGAWDYLDEQIDGRNAVLGLLLKYKTRCEWYHRERLRVAAAKGHEGRKSERALAFDLYEYLHDQGVDFAIESVTASGEPDLVATDAGGQVLVADAKYVTDDNDLAETMAAGFRQVLQYCRDKNEPVGYLVVFLACDVAPELLGERDDGFPCFRLGGITVYYVVVDIRERTKTASKLPKPRVVEIDRDRLVKLIES